MNEALALLALVLLLVSERARRKSALATHAAERRIADLSAKQTEEAAATAARVLEWRSRLAQSHRDLAEVQNQLAEQNDLPLRIRAMRDLVEAAWPEPRGVEMKSPEGRILFDRRDSYRGVADDATVVAERSVSSGSVIRVELARRMAEMDLLVLVTVGDREARFAIQEIGVRSIDQWEVIARDVAEQTLRLIAMQERERIYHGPAVDFQPVKKGAPHGQRSPRLC